MSFLTGRPASATVRVANEIRCCVFDAGVLKALTQKNPGIRQALEFSFNRNLVGKLERMNESNRERVAAILAPGGPVAEPVPGVPHACAPLGVPDAGTPVETLPPPAAGGSPDAGAPDAGDASSFAETRPAGA